MTKHPPNAAPQEFKDIAQLACLEVWGGNRRANHSVELPGLAGWIYSDPVETAELGGDVHYISVCSKGIISRFALADVSGHGRSSSVMAQLLRKLIRKHINTWDQSELMRELSESLRNTKRNGEQYATATLFAYYRPTRELVFTNAGHPAALWYHAKTGTWDWLESATPFARSVEGLPLGLIPGTDYVQVAVQLKALARSSPFPRTPKRAHLDRRASACSGPPGRRPTSSRSRQRCCKGTCARDLSAHSRRRTRCWSPSSWPRTGRDTRWTREHCVSAAMRSTRPRCRRQVETGLHFRRVAT